MAKITSFYVVTKPTRSSGLQDICFQADFPYMERQFKGGLTAKEIVGVYSTKTEATEIAKKEIAKCRK